MSSRLDLFLYLLMALAFGGALWLGRDWPPGARIFPFLIGGAGLLLVLAGLLQAAFTKSQRTDRREKGPSVLKELATFAWISGYFGAVALFGFQWGLPAAILCYLKAEAGLRFLPAFLFTALCWTFLYIMRAYLYIPLYEGWFAPLSRVFG